MKASQWSAMAVLCITAVYAQCRLALPQNVPGAGNGRAIVISRNSPAAKAALEFLLHQAATIHNQRLRAETLDALGNPATCVRHRAGVTNPAKVAILKNLVDAGLVDENDERSFPGGFMSGIFPPVLDDGGGCPHLPQLFISAPGSGFDGHHSYPGGLAVHEFNNEVSDLNLASQYREVYLSPGRQGCRARPGCKAAASEIFISQDVIVGAPLWHDWAKVMVFQWHEDGTEFQELNFGGNGATDNYGKPGDSKTGAHHILGLAETMKRKLPPDFIITQASAHASPTLGNEYKVVNWLRAAAIIAQVDPVRAGYLALDRAGNLRLPALRKLGGIDLNSASPSQPNLLAEYSLHNLSDSDFTYSAPAILSAQFILEKLAADFGYNPADVARYNNHFRNVVLSNLTAERLLILYSARGINGVRDRLKELRVQGII